MKKTRHLFVSGDDKLLPRWREAFPSAHVTRVEALRPENKCDIAWLRVGAGAPVAEQLELIRKHLGAVKCVVLSDQPDDEQALSAFAAAARGYCNAHATAAVLRQVESVVLQDGLWIGESLMQRVLAATARQLTPENIPAKNMADREDWSRKLTVREREIGKIVASGASNKEIARQFGITERTVKAHVGAILEKLKVRDRLQFALLVSGRSSDPRRSVGP